MTMNVGIVKERVQKIGPSHIQAIEVQKLIDYTLRAVLKTKEGEKVKKVYITDTPYEKVANEYKAAAESVLTTSVSVVPAKAKRVRKHKK